MLVLVWLSVLLLFILLAIFITWVVRGDERISQKTLRATFFTGVITFSLFFIAFTWHTLLVIPKTTHTERLTATVAAGKVAWQTYMCIDCHTILGNGAYYAPDLTKSWTRYLDRAGGDDRAAKKAMMAFLLHPPPATRTTRGMPQFAMSEQDALALTEFLEWTSRIDTNNWPPAPLRAVPAPAALQVSESSPGAKLFTDDGCTACHSIGKGRVQGPDLAGVARRVDRATMIAFIQDPQTVYQKKGREPLNEGYPAMPSLEISQNDAVLIADFLIQAKGQP